MSAVDKVTSELHRADPDEFTAQRDRLATEARQSGDQETAGRLRKLRKPVLAAWALNVLRHRDPERVDELFALGEDIRGAQRELRGQQLRDLGGRRDALLDELVRRAVSLAGDAGHPLAQNAVDQVRQTLVAALSDPETAQRLSEGTLVKAAEYSGFGMQELADRVAPPPAKAKPTTAKSGKTARPAVATEAAPEPDRLREWETEYATARAERDAAAEQLDRSRAALSAREREQRQIEQRRSSLRAALAEADLDAREVERALKEANTQFREANRLAELADARVAEVTRRMPE